MIVLIISALLYNYVSLHLFSYLTNSMFKQKDQMDVIYQLNMESILKLK